MSSDFLHGVEIINAENGVTSIQQVKSGVIGLIGTAPVHRVLAENKKINEPVLCLSDIDDALYFYKNMSGYSIPKALADLRKHEVGAVIVINTFDPDTHKTNVESEAKTFDSNNELTLSHIDVSSVVVKDATETTTYTVTTDYTVDAETGKITRVESGSIEAAESVKITYDYADPSLVDNSDIIGEVDSNGNRTGLKGFYDTFNLWGMFAKLLIAPGFTDNAIAAELVVIAEKIGAIALVDAPTGTKYADAIAGRGSEGTINFNHSERRLILCYPHVKSYDTESETEVLTSLAVKVAAIIAETDKNFGYWYSPSNKTIKGITGIEKKLTFMPDNPDCEANILNSKGILTVVNFYGRGLRTFGNRNSSFPGNSDVNTFIPVQRTKDIIEESITYYALQKMDLPATQGWIRSIAEDVNGFLRTLKGRGAILDGKCWFDAKDNTKSAMAAGNYVFSFDFMPPVPGERITFKSTVNTNYLKSLLGGNE